MMKIVGHRGARGLAPENTAESLRKALEHGVDEIEIDVRCTKDGVAVLHHDADLKDLATARYPVSHHTYQELLGHRPDLLSLEQAIEIVDRRVPLQIEIKDRKSVRPVIDTITTFLSKGWLEADLLVGSSKQSVLVDIHRALPEIPLVVIESFLSVRAAARARQIGTRRVSMRSWWLWGYFIRSFSRHGYELYAYTVNDTAKARRWAKAGMAGVITDYPDEYAPRPRAKRSSSSNAHRK